MEILLAPRPILVNLFHYQYPSPYRLDGYQRNTISPLKRRAKETAKAVFTTEAVGPKTTKIFNFFVFSF
jgi:hypothetical protein